MSSANSNNFTSFPIKIPFVSFSSLIAVAKTSKTMLNSSGESEHPCLVPDFRGNTFNFSPLRIMFAEGLSYIVFIMLSYVPSGEGNGNPLQCSCLENPRDGGAWWAAVYGVTQSRTRLKRLSSSSSSMFLLFLLFGGLLS